MLSFDRRTVKVTQSRYEIWEVSDVAYAANYRKAIPWKLCTTGAIYTLSDAQAIKKEMEGKRMTTRFIIVRADRVIVVDEPAFANVETA